MSDTRSESEVEAGFSGVINNNLNDRAGNRNSIKSTLMIGLFIVFVLFFSLTSLTLIRLSEFKAVLTNIQEVSVPTAIHTSRTFSEVNSLIFLTERLIKSDNIAAKRVTNEQIKTKLNALKSMNMKKGKQSYGNTQLKAITVELQELDNLVELRLENKTDFDEKLLALYALFNKMPDLNLQANGKSEENARLIIASIFANSGQLSFLNRLHLVRQIEAELKLKIKSLYRLMNDNATRVYQNDLEFINSLDNLLFGSNGLVQTRIQQLRIEGRTIGRGNFVRNLVTDFANQAEYESFHLNNQVVKETKSATQAISAQLTVVIMSFILSLFIFAIIVYYLQRKVIRRLVKLNQGVNKRLNGSVEDVIDTGFDEISDIAETFNIFANTVDLQKQTLEELSSLDGLTGIANRRAFNERLSNVIASSRRACSSMALIIVDVDFFKPYNDNYGHAKGDDCLKKVARILAGQLPRQTDFLARYGGEEFVCILPMTDEKGAVIAADKLKEAVYSANIPHLFSKIEDRLTISVGISIHSFTNNEDLVTELDLITQADTALYQAKVKGRNRVVVNNGSILRG